MLKREENELLTRTAPGTTMGAFVRRFWFPALLSEELPEPDSPPVRIRLLSENLVAFRDTNGEVGLVAENCPHRGASLFFGRNEEAGLRCVYHGWKFNAVGTCVDMPNEPPESNFKHKVKVIAYPTVEMSGVIWTYMGPPELRPHPPELEWTKVPDSHLLVTKRYQESNYLQALEGGIDSSHISFLHSNLEPPEERGLTSQNLPVFTATDRHPHFEVLETDYGLLIGARRNADDGRYYWRVSQFLSPWFQMIPAAPGQQVSGHVWIPIDDEHCWAWTMTWHPDRPLSEDELARMLAGTGIHATADPKYRPLANKDNDYLQDRQAQRTTSFSGIRGIGEQDMACQESMGRIYDRTKEHLGSSDTAIISMRRLLLRLVRDFEQGVEPPAAAQPSAYRVRSTMFFLPAGESWVERARETMAATSRYYDA
jgi:phthalate 4,5-dioxygenase